MEEPEIQKRVSDLEQQVAALKKAVQASAEAEGPAGRLQRIPRFLIANWALLSFVSALLIAGYVKLKWGVDYFESYENIATNRKVSLIYQKMGDSLMAKSEWKAAEQAYSDALKTNANNAAATRGIVMAQVFQPVAGEKFPAPEVEDAKLNYLQGQFGEDYQIDYLRGVRYFLTGDYDNAVDVLNKCIAMQPRDFAGCYLQRGQIEWAESKVNDAKASYQLAVAADPESMMAQNNLAACDMLLSDFAGAAQGFEKADRISPTMLSAINLGEVYWFQQNFSGALRADQVALYNMNNNAGDMQSRYFAGQWNSGFLPLHTGDLETIKRTVLVDTLEQKKAFLHLELAISYALLERFGNADEEFGLATKPEPLPGHRELYRNRLESVENMVQMPDDARNWLDTHRRMMD